VQSLARDYIAPIFTYGWLVSFLLSGLLFVSAYATYEGIVNLVAAQQGADPNMALRFGAVVSVILITIAMWASLEFARRRGSIALRIAAACFYLFAVVWSVGFGFGFWWSMLVSRSETQQAFDENMQSFNSSLQQAQGQLSGISASVARAAALSDARSAREDQFGGTCGVPSPPGDGPLRRARFGVARDLTLLSQQMDSQWIQPVSAAISEVAEQTSTVVQRAADQTTEQRTAAYNQQARIARNRASTLNGSNATFSRSFSAQISDLAAQLRVSNVNDPNFRCYDPELATTLELAAREASDPPRIFPPEFESNEGPQATREAFNRLWGFFFSGISPSRNLTDRKSMEDNDWIALVAAVIIDVGILFFTLIRPLPVYEDSRSRFPQSHLGAPRDIIRKRIQRSPDRYRSLFERMKFEASGRDYLASPGRACVSEEKENPLVFDNALLQLRAAGLVKAWRAWFPGAWPWKPVVDAGRETLALARWHVPDGTESFSIHRTATADLAELQDLTDESTVEKVTEAKYFSNADPERVEYNDGDAQALIAKLAELDSQIAAGRRHKVSVTELLSQEIIVGQIVNDLEQRGYEVFGRAGDSFDHNKHEAIEFREDPFHARMKIIEVLHRGVAKKRGRFVQRLELKLAAKVVVSSGPAPAQGFRNKPPFSVSHPDEESNERKESPNNEEALSPQLASSRGGQSPLNHTTTQTDADPLSGLLPPNGLPDSQGPSPTDPGSEFDRFFNRDSNTRKE
jgi:hypothetical protein